ncbi:hypothetical protein Tco_1546762 [Tanacetum coccineum]
MMLQLVRMGCHDEDEGETTVVNRVVDHVSKNISASVTLKRLDYQWMHKESQVVMADVLIEDDLEDPSTTGEVNKILMKINFLFRWEALIRGARCSKEKEESREECSKSRKTKKMKCLEESSQQRK